MIGPTEAEKLKKKTIRRNAPKDENLPKLKTILRSIKDQHVTVHEFIGLVAPFTGDNGKLFIITFSHIICCLPLYRQCICTKHILRLKLICFVRLGSFYRAGTLQFKVFELLF